MILLKSLANIDAFGTCIFSDGLFIMLLKMLFFKTPQNENSGKLENLTSYHKKTAFQASFSCV